MNDNVAILLFLCRFFYDMQPLFCSKNDAPQKKLLAAIALGTSCKTSCTSALTTHTHMECNGTVMSRGSTLNFTQHKLCCQFSAYPACWGAPGPKPPSPNNDATVLNQFSSSFFSRYTSAFSGCLLVFSTIRSTIFMLLSFFLRYHSHQIQQKRPTCLHFTPDR